MSKNEPHDSVNHPKHYTSHPSGIECIQITEHMGFNLGNAVKYVWRADLKHDAIEDLRKAVWYIEREIAKRTNIPKSAVAEEVHEVDGTVQSSRWHVEETFNNYVTVTRYVETSRVYARAVDQETDDVRKARMWSKTDKAAAEAYSDMRNAMQS